MLLVQVTILNWMDSGFCFQWVWFGLDRKGQPMGATVDVVEASRTLGGRVGGGERRCVRVCARAR